MRPAATTDRWRQVIADRGNSLADGVAGLKLILRPTSAWKRRRSPSSCAAP